MEDTFPMTARVVHTRWFSVTDVNLLGVFHPHITTLKRKRGQYKEIFYFCFVNLVLEVAELMPMLEHKANQANNKR